MQYDRATCKILTRSDDYLPNTTCICFTRFGKWAREPFVKWTKMWGTYTMVSEWQGLNKSMLVTRKVYFATKLFSYLGLFLYPVTISCEIFVMIFAKELELYFAHRDNLESIIKETINITATMAMVHANNDQLLDNGGSASILNASISPSRIPFPEDI